MPASPVAVRAHGAVRAVVLDSQRAGPVTPFRVLGETGIATRLEASSDPG